MQPQIPGYRVERELGRGGMATVYLARQESLRRQIALKLMAPALASDEEFTRRFLKEGPTAARLIHPNIVKVFDTGAYDGQYYLAMEYISGGTLKQRIRQGLPVHTALAVLRSLAEALGYAHQQNIVHRDVKTQNILMREDGTPVLSDFGIAKALGSTTAMTYSGMSMGSPHYMSPEQLRGEPVDRRTDLYALGILFHEMLTGKVPYTAENSIAIAYQHINAPLPKLPAELAVFQPLLDKLLAKRVDERFEDAAALIRALKTAEAQWLTRTDSPTRMVRTGTRRVGPIAWIAAAALLVVLLVGVGVYIHDQQQQTRQAERQQLDIWLAQAGQALEREDFAAGLMITAEGLAAQPRSTELHSLHQKLQQARTGQQRRLAADERRRMALLEEQHRAEQQRRREADQLLEAARRARDAGEPETSLVLIERGLSILPESPPLLALRERIEQRLEENTAVAIAPAPTVTPRPVTPSPPARVEDSAPVSVIRLEPAPSSPVVSPPVVAVPEPAPEPSDRLPRDEIDHLLARAERQIEDWKLTTPAGDNAHETFEWIARLDGGRSIAERGLQRIAALYRELAEKRLRSGNSTGGLAFVERGLAVRPGDEQLLALRDAIRTRQARRSTSDHPMTRSVETPTARVPATPPDAAAREPEPPSRRFGTF